VKGIDRTRSLGDLVTDCPGLAPEFERLGLDYCCGGERSLEQACREAGLSTDAVVEALDAVERRGPEPWVSDGPG